MDNSSKVTVDRSYFEALLRRADFHTSSQSVPHATNVAISRAEYDSLLRTSREHQLLKDALFQGGVTEETLNLLISSSGSQDQRKDSGAGLTTWDDDISRPAVPTKAPGPTFRDLSWRTGGVDPAPTFNLAPGTAPYSNGLQAHQHSLRNPIFQRQVSYGMTSVPDDTGFDDDEQSVIQSHMCTTELGGHPAVHERRTLFFSGLSDRTTYRDLVSVIKGGKILNINMRTERTATVSFLDGAADFLAWAKKNDIYLLGKRIEVKWADRQFCLNPHTTKKIADGATRNILIRAGLDKGLTESRIRDDMEHIDKLVIIDVKFHGGDAYVSTNSVHNALFARTCMMSRKTYKGCKIEFYADECDVPLPVRTFVPRGPKSPAKKKKAATTNRFGLLDLDGGRSDEENRTPSDHESSGQETEHAGVSLDFLKSDGVSMA